MTAREQELARLSEAANYIADDVQMLFACLTGADPKEATKIKFEPFEEAGRKIPETYQDAARALYAVAATELNKFASQRLCLAIEKYLEQHLTEPELIEFKRKTPMRFPIKQYANILEELADERPDLSYEFHKTTI